MVATIHSQVDLQDAYLECLRISKTHYENFPVISFLLTKKEKNHLAAIYAYARMADDVADEGNLPQHERMLQMLTIEKQLNDCYRGIANSAIFTALMDTIAECKIPQDLLADLLKAFSIDITKQRYQSFQDLINLSKYSANPIGRLILLVFNVKNKEYDTYSDHISTALQLTNFWQDVSIDLNRNRIYIPQDELMKFNLTDDDIINKNYNQAFSELMINLLQKTKHEFLLGQPILTIPDKRLRLYLKLTYLGGNKILQKIESAKYDVLHHRVTITRFEKLLLLIQAMK